MRCPKCGNNVGFIASNQTLWFNDDETRTGFGRKKGKYQSVLFQCNTINCGFKVETWCLLDVKIKIRQQIELSLQHILNKTVQEIK